jgi:hypothetical protein
MYQYSIEYLHIDLFTVDVGMCRYIRGLACMSARVARAPRAGCLCMCARMCVCAHTRVHVSVRACECTHTNSLRQHVHHTLTQHINIYNTCTTRSYTTLACIATKPPHLPALITSSAALRPVLGHALASLLSCEAPGTVREGNI